MTLSSRARAALQRDWLIAVEAESARRAAGREAEDDASVQKFWAKLREMGQRLMAGAEGFEKLAGQLVEVQDWAQLDRLRVAQDISPSEVIAMVLMKDRQAGERLLTEY